MRVLAAADQLAMTRECTSTTKGDLNDATPDRDIGEVGHPRVLFGHSAVKVRLTTSTAVSAAAVPRAGAYPALG